MRVHADIEVSAPLEVVWEHISDPEKVLSFTSGVTRWEVEGDVDRGMGARYKMLMRVGSAEVGGLIEVVEWNPPRDLAFTSVTGVDQRMRWRLRPRPRGRTHVEVRLLYGIAGGGIPGWVAEQLSAPTVRKNLRRTVSQLKRQVEYEQLRREIAARRQARVGSAR